MGVIRLDRFVAWRPKGTIPDYGEKSLGVMKSVPGL